MPPIIKHYIDAEYGQIHVRLAKARSSNSNNPLLCLHQSPKSSLEFETFMLCASQDRDVYAFDYPGYGMSCRPPDEQSSTIELYARSAWAVADQFGLEKLDLFGNHTGGMVCLEMAAERPERIGKISTVSIPLFSDEELAHFENIFAEIPLDIGGTRIKSTWQKIVDRRGPGVTLEMLDRSFYQSMMAGEAYEWGHQAAFRYVETLRKRLANMKHQLVVINPSNDLTPSTRRVTEYGEKIILLDRPEWGYGLLDVYAQEICDLVL